MVQHPESDARSKVRVRIVHTLPLNEYTLSLYTVNICRWHMTATCMRWLLRLMRLKRPKDGKMFFEYFVRKMFTLTEGVARECWRELATWYAMPTLRVNMAVEIDVDDVLSRPMNSLFYKNVEGRPCGHAI